MSGCTFSAPAITDEAEITDSIKTGGSSEGQGETTRETGDGDERSTSQTRRVQHSGNDTRTQRYRGFLSDFCLCELLPS